MVERRAPQEAIQSDADLVHMIIRVANTACADVVIYATETSSFLHQIHQVSDRCRFIAATTHAETFSALEEAGLDVIRLPLRAADKYNQVRHIISVALRLSKVSIGELVVCVLGFDAYPDVGNFAILTDVEPSFEDLAVADLLKLTDGVRPKVLEAAVAVACKVGRAARRGKRIGTIFMLGDSLNVLAGARQLIPNPFQGHEDSTRRITNVDIHNALVELSKLDGAFVVRGDGFIQTAGTFLTPPPVEVELSSGFGARHVAAAAVTKRTDATAIVVSATDGNVRAFVKGRVVLQLNPDVPYGPIVTDEIL